MDPTLMFGVPFDPLKYGCGMYMRTWRKTNETQRQSSAVAKGPNQQGQISFTEMNKKKLCVCMCFPQ